MCSSKESPFVVMKYGGTSVSTAENWHVIGDIVRKYKCEGLKPVVVCSALSGMSDKLETLIKRACAGDRYEKTLEEIKAAHRDLAEKLGLEETAHKNDTSKGSTDITGIDKNGGGNSLKKTVYESLLAGEFDELSRLALGISLTGDAGAKIRARIMAFGELMLTKLGAAFLQSKSLLPIWMDARRMLTARNDPRVSELQQYTNAVCSCEQNKELIEELNRVFFSIKGSLSSESSARQSADLVLTQGFIASNHSDETVLLGRGGSDTSAAYLASALGALRCEIWTDVPGIFTANPYEVPEARLIKTLDYEEAQEITTSGATVLHPRCIAPLRVANIPLLIRCTHTPEMTGTTITKEAKEVSAHVKCISNKSGVLLVSMDAIDMWQQVGFLVEAFSVFKRAGLSIDMVSTSETNVTVSLDANIQALEGKTIDALTAELSDICTVRTIGPCAIVNLVGRHIRTIMHELGPTMKVFEEKRIHLVSQASNDLNFSFVVDEEEAPRLVKKLHELLLEEGGGAYMFGPSWRELFDRHETVKRTEVLAWWKHRAEELLNVAQEGTPAFAYDRETLHERIRDLNGLNAVDQVLYAVKANWHPPLLQEIEKAGFGFECVSIGELEHLDEVFGVGSKLDPKRILFTPNFAPRREYEYAFELGVHVTLDSLYPLVAWPEVFTCREILARLDPGQGRGHHKHVHTAGAHSKFGIPQSDFEELAERTRENNTHIIGLHAHTGSGILKPGNWSETALFFTQLIDLFPETRILDMGGGLGVVEKPGQTPLDMEAVKVNLDALKKAYPDYELWLEPGRFLVAEQGVLLARVTQIKGKGRNRYVGIDVGMNTLIRPALYGAYHEIVNLSKLDQPKDTQANVVGFICESGDTFGYGRRLAQPEEGDILLIGTAGAYGRTMSSHYNLRPPAREVFLGPVPPSRDQ